VRRIIRRLVDECECEECGYPMYVGDGVVDSPGGPVYCSGKCRSDGEARIRTMAGESDVR
jgi:hypothetical protein